MNRVTFLALSILLAAHGAAFAGGNLAKVYIPNPGAKQMSALSAAIKTMGGGWQKGVWSRAVEAGHPLLLPMAEQVTPTYEKLLTELVKAETPDVAQIEAILLEMTDRARDYAYKQAGKFQKDYNQGRISDEDLLASPAFAGDVYAAYAPYMIHGPLLSLGEKTSNLEKRRLALLEQKQSKTMGLAEKTGEQLSAGHRVLLFNEISFRGVSMSMPETENLVRERFGADLSRALAKNDDLAFQEVVEASYRALENESDEVKAMAQGHALHALIEKLMAAAGRPNAATHVQYKGGRDFSWDVRTNANEQALQRLRDKLRRRVIKTEAARVGLIRAGKAAAAVMGRYNGRFVAQLEMKVDDAFRRSIDEAYESLRGELSLDALSGPASLEAAKAQVAELHAAVAALMKAHGRPKAAVVARLIGGLNEGIPMPIEYDYNDLGRDLLLELVAKKIPDIAAGIPRGSFNALKRPDAKTTAMPFHLNRIAGFYEKLITEALKGSSEDKKVVFEKLNNGFDGRIQPLVTVKDFFWGHSASYTRLLHWTEGLDAAYRWLLLTGVVLGLVTILPAVLGAIPWTATNVGMALFSLGHVSRLLSRRLDKVYGNITQIRWVDLYYKLRNSLGSSEVK